MVGAVTGITNASGVLTVTFSLKNSAGMPVTGASSFEFTVAKLVPASAAKPAYWQSYINTSYQSTGGVKALRAVGERASKTTGITEVEAGVYRYTLCTSLAAVANYKYYGSAATRPAGTCPTTIISDVGALTSAAATPIIAALDTSFATGAVHRLAIANRDSGATMNTVIDFIPSSLPNFVATKANQVVTNETCSACHFDTVANRAKTSLLMHGGRRYDINLCVTCHNPGTFDSATSTDTKWAPVDLMTMAHKIHNPEAGDYVIAGANYAEVTYPQDGSFGGVQDIDGAGPYTAKPGVINCRTCHDNKNPKVVQPAGRPAADKDAWQTNASKQACSTCHGSDEYLSHIGDQADNSNCATCHGIDKSVAIAQAHATPFVTPNNPELYPGAKKIEYQISSLTVNGSNQPIVTFRILVDGAWINLKSLPAGVGIGSVNFKLAWSAPMPQPLLQANGLSNGPSIAQPLDYNNFGTMAGSRTYYNNTTSLAKAAYDQPMSVNLSTANLLASLTGPDGNGYFTTVAGIDPGSPKAFPASTTLRAVAIESYLAISTTVNGIATTFSIGGDAVVKGVDATTSLRRSIVDINSCNTCHERVGFHSTGGRANNPDHCVMCHNAELTSSNTYAGLLTVGGVDFEFSEKSNNLKEMVHSIHAAGMREVPFNFIRASAAGGSGGAGPHVFEEVTYPGRLAECMACHKTGTFSPPANASYAWSVIADEPALGATQAAFDPRLSTRQGPSAGACGSCHDGASAKAHFVLNTSTSLGIESCDVCHGPGKTADVAVTHKP
ncbi:MAG: OmcA/MtrC family decaheme c-type cytochrome [Gammaproteobacteria bacterium]|nr:OmcA/MtrC family decaheme c-type cytochrome [Gammaproteobacteria bacterium]